MEFTEWLSKLKIEHPEKSALIEMVTTKVNTLGISDIEKDIDVEIKKAEAEIKNSIKPLNNVIN